jgi:hypothetical protein
MQQLLSVRVVQSGTDLSDDVDREFRRHPLRITADRGIDVTSLDVRHADPQLTVLGPTVMYRQDMRMG